MRRHQCQITDPAAIARILVEAPVGRLATLDAEGFPYVTPVNFVFMDGCIYLHSGLAGEKMENLVRDPRVGFEVDLPLAYLPHDFNPQHNPCRAHHLYHSVIIRGLARVLPDICLEKTQALNALLSKHQPGQEAPFVGPEQPGYRACRVVEIRPLRISGKSELGQAPPQSGYRRHLAQRLAQRGLPGDLRALRDMGYRLQGDPASGWRIEMEEEPPG